MCQLFGINSAKPVSPRFSLEGFFFRGGGTDVHRDGWGVAYYHDNTSHLQVHDRPSHDCARAKALLLESFKSCNVIAHVRKATVGSVDCRNSHPFVRRLWGRDWAFAHNGHLKDYPLDQHYLFNPTGETDSEWAFCKILGSLYDQFGEQKPGIYALHAHLTGISEYLSRHGTFNYLMTDGDILIAHCATELHWAQRCPPFGSVALLDCDRSIDFSQHNDPDDRMIVVATRPLTRGENWHAMAAGDLNIFQHGQPRLTWISNADSQPSRARSA